MTKDVSSNEIQEIIREIGEFSIVNNNGKFTLPKLD